MDLMDKVVTNTTLDGVDDLRIATSLVRLVRP